jgi:hypothetical protein
VQVPPLLFFRWSHWRLSVGSPGFYMLDSILKPVTGVELPKEVFTSRARWMPLIVEGNASTNMFYLLKNILLLILVILKLKCNNLILNEIRLLNALYMCLHAFSLHRESPNPDPQRQTPHFWGGSVTPTTPTDRHVGPPPHALIWYLMVGWKFCTWCGTRFDVIWYLMICCYWMFAFVLECWAEIWNLVEF